jgi:SAM-dependent methyltransferase
MTDRLGASFRDPSGFVFRHQGRVYRQVNRVGADDYAACVQSELYEQLVSERLLVAHREVPGPLSDTAPDLHHCTLLPDAVDFVSYPYEWCFSQLRDAALLTLRIARTALAAGFSLKDASAYNVQFAQGRPIFIDTLSFERRREGEPWIAYRQFCQHFVAPLALMAYRDVRLGNLLRVHLDGVPLDLACALLPSRVWLHGGLLMHLRLHASFERRHAGDAGASPPRPLTREALDALLGSLERILGKLVFSPGESEWSAYAEGDSYDEASLAHKQALVARHLAAQAPKRVWDLGANTGAYSRLAASAGAQVVAFDADPACVERAYCEARERSESRILPLVLDLANPSPGLGWANAERDALPRRGRPDLILALALVHHLAIACNVPLPVIAEWLASLADALLIEFVPKSDPKVRTLLATRRDSFGSYTREDFEAAFRAHFELAARDEIDGSVRTLYRMQKR